MTPKAERKVFVDATHKGPVVNIVSWIALELLILLLFIILGSKHSSPRKVGTDDLLLGLAVLFAIGQCVAVNEQVLNGLGSQLHTLTGDNVRAFEAAGYASEILYILTLVFTKSSTLTALKRLTPDKIHRRVMWLVILFVSLWGIAAFLGSIFQCSLPYPYAWRINTGVCFHQVAFWQAVGVLDICTDIAIMACPAVIVYNLHITFKKKANVVFAFALRFLAIGATMCRIFYARDAFEADDFPFAAYPFAMSTQVAIFFGIFSSMSPQLRPFMDSMQAGYFSSVIPEEVVNKHNRVPLNRRNVKNLAGTTREDSQTNLIASEANRISKLKELFGKRFSQTSDVIPDHASALSSTSGYIEMIYIDVERDREAAVVPDPCPPPAVKLNSDAYSRLTQRY